MAHGAAWFCSGPSHDQVKEYRYVGAEVVDEEGEPFEELYSKLVEELKLQMDKSREYSCTGG